jgi:thiol-disulfide isomerase/thioredoxin
MLNWIKWLGLGIIAFTVASCDYIDDPIQGGGNNPNPTDSIVKKVLVEDYTGHKCPNCPAAAEEAENLKDLYGKQVVLIAVHAGFFATPSPGFDYDFRTPEGDDLNSFFGFTAYPSGMVDRTGYSGQHILNYQAWPPKVADELLQEPEVSIDLTASLNGNSIEADIEIESLTELDGSYYLVLAITEDSIIQPQVNQLPQGGTETLSDYRHNHVLRGHMNGTWGDEVISGNFPAGQTVTYSNSINLGSDWNENHLHVVAYLYDLSDYRVLQAEEVTLP